MELLAIGILVFIIYKVFFRKEGGTIERIDMKMSPGDTQANYKYLNNISCPYCGIQLSIPDQGNWLCHQCEKMFVYYKNDIYKSEEIHSIIAIFITIILAKFCKVDGVVTKEELNIVENCLKDYLDASELQMNGFKKIFNIEAKNSDYLEDYMTKFHEMIKTNPESKKGIAVFLIETMFHLASVGNRIGAIHEKHNETIFKVVQIFNIDINTYETLKEKYIKDRKYYYKILQCSPEATAEEVKNQYRNLCKKYHPDNYLSKGLPKEIIDLTAEKFREINEAYEILMNDLR